LPLPAPARVLVQLAAAQLLAAPQLLVAQLLVALVLVVQLPWQSPLPPSAPAVGPRNCHPQPPAVQPAVAAQQPAAALQLLLVQLVPRVAAEQQQL